MQVSVSRYGWTSIPRAVPSKDSLEDSVEQVIEQAGTLNQERSLPKPARLKIPWP